MLETRIDNYESINLESALGDSIFVEVQKFSKMSNNLFASLSDKLYQLLNFKDHIDSLVVDNTHRELALLSKDSSVFQKHFDEIKEESIPVPLGFNGNLVGISGVVNKYMIDYITLYEKHMEEFNKDLTMFINNADTRTQLILSYDNRDLKKKLVEMDKAIHDQLTKYESPTSTISDLFLAKKGFGEVVKNLMPIVRKVNSKKMKEYVSVVKSMNIKLKALQDMVEVEKDTVSKKALMKMIEEIELAANMATLMGKYMLATYETVNILKSTSKVLHSL